MSIIHVSVGTSFPPSRSSSVSFPGNPAHLGADVSQEEESHCAGHAGDLSYPEGCGPAVVLGNCTERQSSQETPNCNEKQTEYQQHLCAPRYLSTPAFAYKTVP